MATISALANKLDLVLKRIHSTFTGKLDVDAQSADSALLGGKTPAQVRADVISNELAHVNGRPGEVPVFDQDGVAMSVKAVPLLKLIQIASTTAEINALKAAVSRDDIVDKRDTTVWSWNDTAWIDKGQFATSSAAIQRGIFYKDTVAFAVYYIDINGKIFMLGAPGILNW
jgi:hypothetical protein